MKVKPLQWQGQPGYHWSNVMGMHFSIHEKLEGRKAVEWKLGLYDGSGNCLYECKRPASLNHAKQIAQEHWERELSEYLK